MKNLKLVLITTVIIAPMVNVIGQTLNKKEEKYRLKNNSSYGESINPKVLGNDYSFSMTTGTYSDLEETISVNNNQPWDDPEYVIPIGFDFDLYDITIDSIYIGIGMGGLVSSKIDTNYIAEYLIIPFETDLIDRGIDSVFSQSPISYKLEGTTGNRILKIEWKNAGFYDEMDVLGTLDDYINFQLWLFEETNDIEIHFGPNMITNPEINYWGETGATIGLAGMTDDYEIENAYFLSGEPSNPIIVDTLVYLNGTPSDGTIYKFSKSTTGIEVANLSAVIPKVYPNPTNGIFNIEKITSESSTYKVTDITGKLIQQGMLTGKATVVDLSKNIRGVYFLKTGSETIKLIKQ